MAKDPLSGIDSIKWRRMMTAYENAEDIPHHLRALRSADVQARTEARDFIIHSVNHQGDIYDATVAITPWLVALLAADDTPDKPLILALLAGFAISIEARFELITTLGFFDQVAKLYINLRAGFALYRPFLFHPDAGTRDVAVMLLRLLHDQSAATRVQLWRAFRQETDPVLRGEIIEALAGAFPDTLHPQTRLLQRYQACFVHYMAEVDDVTVRAELAIAWIRCEHLLKGITRRVHPPQNVIDALLGGLRYPMRSRADRRRAVYLERFNTEVALAVFSRCDLHPYFLHVIARHLMLRSFESIISLYRLDPPLPPYMQRSRYDRLLHLRKAPDDPMHYTLDDRPTISQRNTDLDYLYIKRNIPRRDLLQAITACDRFWELETNLFSFFFGLPDEREALVALLNE